VKVLLFLLLLLFVATVRAPCPDVMFRWRVSQAAVKKAAMGGIKAVVGTLAKEAAKAAAAHLANAAKAKVTNAFTGLVDGVKSIFGGGSEVEKNGKTRK
jgi:hypothetical protein